MNNIKFGNSPKEIENISINIFILSENKMSKNLIYCKFNSFNILIFNY